MVPTFTVFLSCLIFLVVGIVVGVLMAKDEEAMDAERADQAERKLGLEKEKFRAVFEKLRDSEEDLHIFKCFKASIIEAVDGLNHDLELKDLSRRADKSLAEYESRNQ